MVESLQTMFERFGRLSEDRQIEIAALIAEAMEDSNEVDEDEREWRRKFAASPHALERLAQEAMEERSAGLTEPWKISSVEIDHQSALQEALPRLTDGDQAASGRHVRGLEVRSLSDEPEVPPSASVLSRLLRPHRRALARGRVREERRGDLGLDRIGSHSDYDKYLDSL